MKQRIAVWAFALVAALVLVHFGVYRGSWSYLPVMLGLILVSEVVSRVVIRWKRR
ncbi:MAG TPA: hypothetical protein VGH79_05205 [Gaiellaceae bacterium]|jgi:hypothetical protein